MKNIFLRWILRLIQYRQHRMYSMFHLFVVITFVALTRMALESMMCVGFLSSRDVALYALNSVAFYTAIFFSFAAVAGYASHRSIEQSYGVTLVGLMLGLMPPFLDVMFGQAGLCKYRYFVPGVTVFPEALWFWDTTTQSFGECCVLWMSLLFLCLYVWLVTQRLIRVMLALVGGYSVIWLCAGLAVPFEMFFEPFLLPALKMLQRLQEINRTGLWVFPQLSVACLLYVSSKKKLRQAIMRKVVHTFPFLALSFLGFSMQEYVQPIWPNSALSLFLIYAMCLCLNTVFCCVANDALEMQTGVTQEDAIFFGVVTLVLNILMLLIAGNVAFWFLGIYCCTIAYNAPFIYGKKYFPTNYKIEGFWAWASFCVGANAALAAGKIFDKRMLVASLLVFGGFSVLNALKDYKDIFQDRREKIQTLYLILWRRGVLLKTTHAYLRLLLFLGLCFSNVLFHFYFDLSWFESCFVLMAFVAGILCFSQGSPKTYRFQGVMICLTAWFCVAALLIRFL